MLASAGALFVSLVPHPLGLLPHPFRYFRQPPAASLGPLHAILQPRAIPAASSRRFEALFSLVPTRYTGSCTLVQWQSQPVSSRLEVLGSLSWRSGKVSKHPQPSGPPAHCSALFHSGPDGRPVAQWGRPVARRTPARSTLTARTGPRRPPVQWAPARAVDAQGRPLATSLLNHPDGARRTPTPEGRALTPQPPLSQPPWRRCSKRAATRPRIRWLGTTPSCSTSRCRRRASRGLQSATLAEPRLRLW